MKLMKFKCCALAAGSRPRSIAASSHCILINSAARRAEVARFSHKFARFGTFHAELVAPSIARKLGCLSSLIDDNSLPPPLALRRRGDSDI